MADVTRPRRNPARSTRERAQLLIVIGIVVAISLVSLALFLNSIIYAENVGARGADVGGSDASVFLDSAEDGGDGIIRAVNHGHTSFADQTDAFDASLEDWNKQSRLHYTFSGSYTEVEETESFEPGTQIVQEGEDRAFTSADDEEDWTLAVNVKARDFVLDVTKDSLDETDSDPFELCVSDGESADVDNLNNDCEGELSESTSLLVYENADENVVVTDEDEFECETQPGEDRALLEFTAGTLNGRDCDVSTVFDDYDTYDISYINGGSVEGQYRFVVDEPDHDPGLILDTPLSSDPYNTDPGDPPYAGDAIWSAEISVRYESAQIEYQSKITLVPGEIDD